MLMKFWISAQNLIANIFQKFFLIICLLHMRTLIILKDGHTKWGPDFASQFYMRYWLQILSYMLEWHKICMMTTWSRYSLQTRYKMKTRFCACSIEFQFCQMCWSDKRITSITSSWLSIACAQFPVQIENEDYILHIKLHMHYFALQTLLDM